jgi:hypothetical protein
MCRRAPCGRRGDTTYGSKTCGRYVRVGDVAGIERHADVDRRALPQLRAYGDLPFYQPRPFFDADKAQAAVLAGATWIESPSVVGDRQHDLVVLSCERDDDLLRMSMSRGVSDRLLRDAKQRQDDNRAPRLDLAFYVQLDPDVVLTLDVGAVRFERRGEARMLQQARMQVVRQQAEAFRHPRQSTLKREQTPLHVRILKRRRLLPEVADVDGNCGYFLAGVVVEVSRDASTLHLLRENELAGKLPDLRVTASEGGFTDTGNALDATSVRSLCE